VSSLMPLFLLTVFEMHVHSDTSDYLVAVIIITHQDYICLNVKKHMYFSTV